MLIELKLEGKYVVVVGGGSESYRKTFDFVKAGAKILVVSGSFSRGIQKLQEKGKISLRQEHVGDPEAFFCKLKPKPDLLVAITNNHDLNSRLIAYAKSAGCMVYAPGNPSLSDFVLPAVARIGDVKIAVSTSGKSPAMASVLRQRIEAMITVEDLLQIKLQDQIREILKTQRSHQKNRKQMLYKVMDDPQVKALVKNKKFEEAKEKALKIIQSFNTNKSSTSSNHINKEK